MVGQRQGATPRIVAIKHLAQRFTYVTLILAAFALMMLGKADAVLVDRFRAHVTDAVAPILDILSRPAATVHQVVDQGRELLALREEVARLREANARLQRWQTAARNLEIENQALRGLLGFVPDPAATFISARVIGDQGGAFAHSLILNAGERDGVRKGQAVMSGEGLVGRVASVGERSARVLLLTDLNSRIPVVVESTRTRALLVGTNEDRPEMDYLAVGATVSAGDRVTTSGHAGAFPPGIPVGVVTAVADGHVRVQPYIDRHRIEFVRVVDYGLTGIISLPGGQGGKGRRAQ